MITIVVTMVDKNAFDFKCNIAIRSGFKKKTDRNSEDQYLKDGKSILNDQYLLKRLVGQSRTTYVKYSYICKIYQKYSWCI